MHGMPNVSNIPLPGYGAHSCRTCGITTGCIFFVNVLVHKYFMSVRSISVFRLICKQYDSGNVDNNRHYTLYSMRLHCAGNEYLAHSHRFPKTPCDQRNLFLICQWYLCSLHGDFFPPDYFLSFSLFFSLLLFFFLPLFLALSLSLVYAAFDLFALGSHQNNITPNDLIRHSW